MNDHVWYITTIESIYTQCDVYRKLNENDNKSVIKGELVV